MDLVSAALILVPTQALGWLLFWAAGLYKSGPSALSYWLWLVAALAVLLILVVPFLIMLAITSCYAGWGFLPWSGSCV